MGLKWDAPRQGLYESHARGLTSLIGDLSGNAFALPQVVSCLFAAHGMLAMCDHAKQTGQIITFPEALPSAADLQAQIVQMAQKTEDEEPLESNRGNTANTAANSPRGSGCDLSSEFSGQTGVTGLSTAPGGRHRRTSFIRVRPEDFEEVDSQHQAAQAS